MIVLNSVILGFAFIGVLVVGRKIFSTKLGAQGKVIACLALLAVVGGIFNPNVPIIGLFNPLAAILATIGIVVVAMYAYKKSGKEWRLQTATVLVTLGLLATIWLPVYLNPVGALPRVPIGGFTSSSTSVSVAPTRISTIAQRQASPPLEPCDQMIRSIRKNVPRCNP